MHLGRRSLKHAFDLRIRELSIRHDHVCPTVRAQPRRVETDRFDRSATSPSPASRDRLRGSRGHRGSRTPRARSRAAGAAASASAAPTIAISTSSGPTPKPSRASTITPTITPNTPFAIRRASGTSDLRQPLVARSTSSASRRHSMPVSMSASRPSRVASKGRCVRRSDRTPFTSTGSRMKTNRAAATRATTPSAAERLLESQQEPIVEARPREQHAAIHRAMQRRRPRTARRSRTRPPSPTEPKPCAQLRSSMPASCASMVPPARISQLAD